MAYSNVGTPVFYVDNYLYHKAIGTELKETSASSGGVKPSIIPEAYTLNPSFANNINNEADWDTSGMSFTIPLAYDVDKYDFTGNDISLGIIISIFTALPTGSIKILSKS